MLLMKFRITSRRRANLTALADYLESLPEDYSHFEMETYTSHVGSCDLVSDLDEEVATAIEQFGQSDADENTLYATSIEKFLGNCGTSACALGHGPAAGIPLAKTHLKTTKFRGVSIVTDVDFAAYAKSFVVGEYQDDWEFLFGGDWADHDNHHWGAAARIRFFLEWGGIPAEHYTRWDGTRSLESLCKDEAMPIYEPYRVDRREALPA